MKCGQVEPIRVIVNRRIDTLLKKAVEVVDTRQQDAREYVKLAKKLSMRHRIPMGKNRKKLFCKVCENAWKQNYNLQIVNEEKWEIYKCTCGATRKFHI